jgi:hypothetical protein
MAAASSEASLNPMDARRNIKLYIVCFSGIFSNSAATLEQTIEFIDLSALTNRVNLNAFL